MIDEGVIVGDVVQCDSLPTPGGRAVVVGVMVAHPTLPEYCYLLRPGDRAVRRIGPWPPGGDLTAEAISHLVRSHARRNRR